MSDTDRPQYSWSLDTHVVSIDIGTSKCVMHLTKVGQEQNVQVTLYPKGCNKEKLYREKVQTTVLLQLKYFHPLGSVITNKSQVEVLAFGDEAEERFASDKSLERSCIIFLKWFKMKLHQTRDVPNPVLSCGPYSPKILLSVALEITLSLFKDALLDHLKNDSSDVVVAKDIVWTLTVPAIWSEGAKRMMRMAAYSAGLIDDIESPRLVLCLEPEAVCFEGLYGVMSHSLPAYTPKDLSDVSERSLVGSVCGLMSTKGQKFVVLDAGGGTVDIASYEVVSSRPFQVKQLAAPTGGPFGSTQVDGAFMEFLRAMLEGVSPEAKAALDARYDVQVATLRSWEVLKLNIELDPCDADSVLPSVIQLEELHSQVLEPLGLNLRSVIGLYAVQHEEEPCPVARGETRCELPGRLLQALFRPSIGLIEGCLRSYLQETPAGAATHLILAGGYSRSNMLWRAIKNSFGGVFGGQILMVAEPDTAIVRGAAIYGTAHKHLLTHRIASHTYGFEIMAPFNRIIHADAQHTIVLDEKSVGCIPVFEVFVTAGDEIPVGMVTDRKKARPFRATQSACDIQLLSTTSTVVKYPDEEGVMAIGSFTIPVDMTVPHADRLFETEYSFGDVELCCRSFCCHTGALLGSRTANILSEGSFGSAASLGVHEEP